MLGRLRVPAAQEADGDSSRPSGLSSAPVASPLWRVNHVKQVTVVDVVRVYLCPEPAAEAAGDHAPGVRLKGQHGAEMPPEHLTDKETTATGLQERDTETGGLVADEELPGPEDGLKA